MWLENEKIMENEVGKKWFSRTDYKSSAGFGLNIGANFLQQVMHNAYNYAEIGRDCSVLMVISTKLSMTATQKIC